MTRLTVFAEDNGTEPLASYDGDYTAIAGELKAIGVDFMNIPPKHRVPEGSTAADIHALYDDLAKTLKDQHGYQSSDVVALPKGAPNVDEMRAKFLSEHIHKEDEVRYFIAGSGAFYLHEGGKVFMVVCEEGDFISVPNGARHWFDMGPDPEFTALRLFTNPDGWVAEYTGDEIAKSFPLYE